MVDQSHETFDVVVVGGGPAGATAAADLARSGHRVLLLDRDGRIKPCGGAIPPRLMREFAIPEHLLVARATGARIMSPSAREIDMPIDAGFVGMVDRDIFDEWLRRRAEDAGAVRRTGTFEAVDREGDGSAIVRFRRKTGDRKDASESVRARVVIGADGALSAVARQFLPDAARVPYVFAYHEVIRTPAGHELRADAARCDIYYKGTLSPDFYGWIFPHGETASIGTGSAKKGFPLRAAVSALRKTAGLADAETIRCEGSPIPQYPLRRWDNGRDIVLAGDAAGVVAPASGEGIYYAMLGGRLAADAAGELCRTGDARALASARKRFMRLHGRVFWILGIMQRFWYASDARRERFVSLCNDADIQSLTWQSYMNKELVRASPLVNARIFVKNIAHLSALVSA